MYKKILFILVLFLIFLQNIKAEDVLTCVYEKESNVITVKMDTEYKFDVTTNFLGIGCTVDQAKKYTKCIDLNNDLQFNDFVKDKAEFYCPEEMYLNEYSSSGGSAAGSKSSTTYTVSRQKQKEKISGSANSGGGGYEIWEETKEIYKLNTKKSSINIKTTTDSNNEQGWIRTCNYENIIFRFNNTTYEFVSTGNYKVGTIPGHEEDLMQLLKKNEYACPVSLCINEYNNRGYKITDFDYYFDNSKANEDNCIIGAEYSDKKYKCVGVDKYYTEFIKNHNHYLSTKSTQYINLRNESKEQLSIFCSSALANLNYEGADNCIKDCLEVKKEINEILNIKNDNECGFSARLMVWIANILRWIKYIVPVIVIVMGILDFIKAIAADRDDEMKKAQGRFIKRLIAAALVFIIPLIIEFVLDKMGFGYDDCAIFDKTK